MLWITKNRYGMDCVNITRGDDATLAITLEADGEAYTLGVDEYLVFGVRKKPMEHSELLLEIEGEPGESAIHFEHADTAELRVGEYSAEVQLMRDEQRVTVWPQLPESIKTSTDSWLNFCVTPEVVTS